MSDPTIDQLYVVNDAVTAMLSRLGLGRITDDELNDLTHDVANLLWPRERTSPDSHGPRIVVTWRSEDGPPMASTGAVRDVEGRVRVEDTDSADRFGWARLADVEWDGPCP